jgi:hypothetical protein
VPEASKIILGLVKIPKLEVRLACAFFVWEVVSIFVSAVESFVKLLFQLFFKWRLTIFPSRERKICSRKYLHVLENRNPESSDREVPKDLLGLWKVWWHMRFLLMI